MMDNPPINILLVEDNPADVILIREALEDSARSPQFQIVHVERLSHALERLAPGDVDVVLLDLGLPDSRGLATFHALHENCRSVAIIVLSGLSDEKVAIEAVQAGAQDYLVKGQIDLNPMARAIRYAIVRRRLMEHVEVLSVTDELTLLPNRRGFGLFAEQFMRLARRTGEGFWLLMLDLDGLKKINDTHGHAAGDRALTEFARLLRLTLRESDVLARLSGDEFVALALGAGESVQRAVRERLDAAVRDSNAAGFEAFELGFSLGAAHFDPVTALSLEALMAQADERLYAHKRAKREGQ
jgi:diguanylate cyclase (GGDEF)-like protein